MIETNEVISDHPAIGDQSLNVQFKHSFDDFELDVSFKSGPGITALFGASGAGKSTVVNALAGLFRPHFGKARLGADVFIDTEEKIFLPPERRHIGYVFQDSRLFPHLTVEKNLLFGEKYSNIAKGVELDSAEAIKLLNLGALLNRFPHSLSGGEKQRVAIGRALLSGPQLLLLDEPLASLDGARRREILPFLEWLRDSLQIPILYVSHNAEEVIRLADHVVIMDHGQATKSGSVDEVVDELYYVADGDGDASNLLSTEQSVRLSSFFTGKVREHILYDGLTRLEFNGLSLFVPKLDVAVGRTIRTRIFAKDVALSLVEPQSTSVLNTLEGTIAEIDLSHPSHADIRVVLSNDFGLWSRISKRSARVLNLETGTQVWALIKTLAMEIGSKEKQNSY